MAEPKKILLVEDEHWERQALKEALSSGGYRVLEAEGAKVGQHLFRTQEPDLVILDVKLADGDGMQACREIRAHKSRGSTPVILLTGQGNFESKAEGFGAGADQYLVKPVSPKEVLLWAQALLRRPDLEGGAAGRTLEAGELFLDLDAHLARYRGAIVPDLTRKELELLFYLVKKRPAAASRKQILAKLWHTISVDKVVDFHVGNLRRKLPPELADKVQTVPGKGFRFFEPS